MIQEFYSCGKLLITGEYLIMRGARGLALPTSRGQHMTVDTVDSETLSWFSLDVDGELWFQAELELDDLSVIRSTDDEVARRLKEILLAARKLSPNFLRNGQGFEVRTELEFPSDWGLGSSSTLLNNIAHWSGVDAFDLLSLGFGGSGYDVKVSKHGSAIRYHREEEKGMVEEVDFKPSFSNRLWFVHLDKKQNSAAELVRFSEMKVSDRDLDQVSRITDEVIKTDDLEEFERLMREHDFLLSRIIAMPSAEEAFPEFKGLVKYLGAWGGDFMLATGSKKDMDYFRERGLKTVLSYNEMIKE